MAVSSVAYRVVVRAAKSRVASGEPVEDVVKSYTRLSDEQRERLFEELPVKKQETGGTGKKQ